MGMSNVAEGPAFNRTDIAIAYAVYWSLNHTGQWSRGYARLCAAMHILDGWCPDEQDLLDLPNAEKIYRNLCTA
jgi:hypothetical protein